MKTPNIFISHRWTYSDNYYDLTQKFWNRGWQYYDYSVPQHDPFDRAAKSRISQALKEQVRQCNVFIVFARHAMSFSEWVEKEVDYALYYDKPIIGVIPWGYQGNIPVFIQEACYSNGELVGYNAPSIIRKIESWL